YPQLERNSKKLVEGILDAAKATGVAMTANRVGSMFTWFFNDNEVNDWGSSSKTDTKRFAKFHRAMLERGGYLPGSQYEAAFLRVEHNEGDIGATVSAAKEALGTNR